MYLSVIMLDNVIKICSSYLERKLVLSKIQVPHRVRRVNCKNYSVCKMNTEFYKKFALPPRLAGSDKNVWMEYIQLANKYNPINLGQGFPDFFPPNHVVKALEEISKTKDGLMHQYARSFGHPRLVNALSQLYSKQINHEIDPMTEVLIGVGATEILLTIFLGHLQEEDEVIVIEPFFDCYFPMIKLSGAKPVFIPLQKKKNTSGSSSHEWVLDQDELTRLFGKKTKMIIINTPHNPIGKVYTKEELTFIGELCKKWNVLCVSDEVYEWMVYKPYEHVRIASLPDMWERTITIGSAGKAFSVTGWKIGWAYGPERLIRNLRVVHQNSVYTCPTILQEAVAVSLERELKVLNTPESYFQQIKDELEPKRNFMVKVLSDMGMKPVIPEGGYFVIADFSPLLPKVDLSEETDQEMDYKFTKWMTKNIGVLAIPPSVFYSEEHKSIGENFARFCFIKQDVNLQKAADRLLTWKEKSSKRK